MIEVSQDGNLIDIEESETLLISEAPRRLACPGSVALSKGAPKLVSDYLDECALAKAVALNALFRKHTTFTNLLKEDLGVVTEEMRDGADFFMRNLSLSLDSDLWGSGRDHFFSLAHTVRACRINSSLIGRVDLWVLNLKDPKNPQLAVFDYRFGHRWEHPKNNMKLVECASGVLSFLSTSNSLINRVDWDIEDLEINLYNVQPRAFSKPEYVRFMGTSYNYQDFEALEERLRIAEARSFNTGKDRIYNVTRECGFCPVRAQCSALQGAALEMVGVCHTAHLNTLTPQGVGNELRLLKGAKEILDARVSALEAEATCIITSGKNVPFYKMESGQARTVWAVSKEEVAAAAEIMGVPGVIKTDVVTPLQAIKAGMPADFVDSMSHRVQSALKLVEVDSDEVDEAFNN